MKFTPTILAGCYIVDLKLVEDARGWFTRTYCKDGFAGIGFTKEWVQHNHTYTKRKGAVRGMHYQQLPFAETKLVRCIAGAVYDVVVDLRVSSPTYLQHISIELSAFNKKMLFIPEGFAHGFQTITDDCELLYCHSEFYNPSSEKGLLHNDPELNIMWPLNVTQISERDAAHLLIKNDFAGLNI